MPLEVVILAAGEGKRMRSHLPKVLHRLAGKPIVEHVQEVAATLNPAKIHLVIQPQQRAHFSRLCSQNHSNFVPQEEQLGTAHAVAQAIPQIDDESTVLVLCGDAPLVRSRTLQACAKRASESVALVSAVVDNPSGFGRIVRTDAGVVNGIVEHRDATEDQLTIREINSGIIGAPKELLARLLPEVQAENEQREYYLTDLIGLASLKGLPIECVVAEDSEEALGINDRVQLADVERRLQRRRANELLLQGVGIADPARLDIRGSLKAGRDCYLDVNVVFEGDVVLGSDVQIGPGCVIKDCEIADSAIVKAHSVLENANVGQRCEIGPYARIRPGSVLEQDVRVGNFVEVKAAQLGEGTKAGHLAYIGDAELGKNVNVGAGAITCNFDGKDKHRTVIGDDVFVGTNCTLVAPLKVDNGAFLAAGSTITKDVEGDALAVGRTRQRVIKNWRSSSRRKR